jgi:CheY-like chemotaxis protein/HPt (histidine-containing phosphotransfer) domain-containing protein
VNQKVILRQIEMLGHAAEVANHGAEALRLWRSGGFALLLTDLHMPEMDGYSLAEAIRLEEAVRGLGAGARMPILALTANALRDESLRARAVGIDDYLTKPIQLRTLKAALAKWLRRDGDDSILTGLDEDLAGARPPPALDVSVLEELVGRDPAVVQEFLLSYRAAAQQASTELLAAGAAHDARHVGAIAHKLKSSSRSVGAMALGDLCAELENACVSGARDGMARGLVRFEPALAEVDRLIGAYLDRR